MGSLHRIRVVAVGSEADMLRLNRTLLANGGWLHDPEDRPPYTLEELYAQVRQRAGWESGGSDAFLYSMVADTPYGEAEPGARYDMLQVDGDLWAACFTYDSGARFQGEDWLQLHLRCDRLPLFVLHADQSFAGDKGYVMLTNGALRENWDRMAEGWLWLIDQYEEGLSPEEAVRRLEEVQRAMAREDWDQSVPELLESCMANLRAIEAEGAVTAQRLAERLERQDYAGCFELQAALADALLWDTARNARHLAVLRQDLDAWQQAHGS